MSLRRWSFPCPLSGARYCFIFWQMGTPATPAIAQPPTVLSSRWCWPSSTSIMTDIVFVQSAWADGGVTIPSLAALLSTVFIILPFCRQRGPVNALPGHAHGRGSHPGRVPHQYVWFHEGSHQAAIVFAWVVSFMNVSTSWSCWIRASLHGWSWCQAPWADHDEAARWLKVASLSGVLLEDIPQLALQVYLLLNTKPSTVTVVAVSSSSIMLVHGLMERVVMWVVRTLSPAGKVVPEFAKPYGDYQLFERLEIRVPPGVRVPFPHVVRVSWRAPRSCTSPTPKTRTVMAVAQRSASATTQGPCLGDR